MGKAGQELRVMLAQHVHSIDKVSMLHNVPQLTMTGEPIGGGGLDISRHSTELGIGHRCITSRPSQTAQ